MGRKQCNIYCLKPVGNIFLKTGKYYRIFQAQFFHFLFYFWQKFPGTEEKKAGIWNQHMKFMKNAQQKRMVFLIMESSHMTEEQFIVQSQLFAHTFSYFRLKPELLFINSIANHCVVTV